MTDVRLQLENSNRQILKLALPISFALLVPQLNFITNNIFLGHLSQQALASGSITGVYYLIFAAIGFGLNNGLQSLISRRAGEGKQAEIGRLFNQGLYISLFIAAAGIVLTMLVGPLVFRGTIQSATTYGQTIGFLNIRIWGLPFLYVYQMQNALMVGTNRSRYLIIGTCTEALSNVFFDYGLIFGKFGLPMMGFNGAAVASVIAEFMGMLATVIVIQWKGIARHFSLYRNFPFDRGKVRSILQVSAPLVFQTGISIISWEFFYLMIEHHGKTALAVSNTMRNIFGFFGVFTWAFAATSNAMVSNLIGQGKSEDVIKLVYRITSISAGVGLGVCLLLNLFPGLFLGIYGQGQFFVEQGIPVVRVVAFAMLFMSAGTVWLNAVTGSGNSRMTLLIEVFAVILYSLYVYFVVEKFRMPLVVAWMVEWIYWLTLLGFSYLYIRGGRWKTRVI